MVPAVDQFGAMAVWNQINGTIDSMTILDHALAFLQSINYAA